LLLAQFGVLKYVLFMETVDPKTMPRMIHVIPRRGKWRVKWSDGKRALRLLPKEQDAIHFAKKRAAGRFSVIVHTPTGYADVKRSIVVPKEFTTTGIH
jgi:hypothetical protein